MFKASHFVAAILCAVTSVVLNPEHNPEIRDRLEAMDRATLEAWSNAVAIIRLTPQSTKSGEVVVTYKGGEWVMEPAQ